MYCGCPPMLSTFSNRARRTASCGVSPGPVCACEWEWEREREMCEAAEEECRAGEGDVSRARGWVEGGCLARGSRRLLLLLLILLRIHLRRRRRSPRDMPRRLVAREPRASSGGHRTIRRPLVLLRAGRVARAARVVARGGGGRVVQDRGRRAVRHRRAHLLVAAERVAEEALAA